MKMKHYDYLEWLFYKEKVFPKEKLNEMEEHLYICDNCMDIFLSLIGNDEVDKAEGLVSKDFTNEVMNNIQNIKHGPIPKVESRKTRTRDIFVYYVAVASVAIFLTLGGFYSGMVDMVPYMTGVNSNGLSINAPNVVFNMSQEIVSKTQNFINDFETSNYKEELR